MLDKKGSALIWAVCTLLILMLVLSAVLTSSAAYHARSVRETEKNQAYLTARSAVDAVLATVNGYEAKIVGEDELGDIIPGEISEEDVWEKVSAENILLVQSGRLDLTNFNFGSQAANMGTITGAYIERIEGTNTWKVSVSAAYGRDTETVTATLQMIDSKQEASYSYVPEKTNMQDIFKTFYFSSYDNPGSRGSGNSATIKFYNADIYIENIVTRPDLRRLTFDNHKFVTAMTLTESNDPNFDRAINYSTADREGVLLDGASAYLGNESDFSSVAPPAYINLTPGISTIDIPTVSGTIDYSNKAAQNGYYKTGNTDNYFRYVSANATLKMNSLPSNSEVYIFLGPSAHLTITNANSSSKCVFVYGPAESQVTISTNNTSFYGAIIGPEVTTREEMDFYYYQPKSEVELAFADDEEQIENGEAGYRIFRWQFVTYGD